MLNQKISPSVNVKSRAFFMWRVYLITCLFLWPYVHCKLRSVSNAVLPAELMNTYLKMNVYCHLFVFKACCQIFVAANIVANVFINPNTIRYDLSIYPSIHLAICPSIRLSDRLSSIIIDSHAQRKTLSWEFFFGAIGRLRTTKNTLFI